MFDFDYSPELFSMHFILHQMHSGIPGCDERGIEMASLLQMVNKRITILLMLPLLGHLPIVLFIQPSCSFKSTIPSDREHSGLWSDNPPICSKYRQKVCKTLQPPIEGERSPEVHCPYLNQGWVQAGMTSQSLSKPSPIHIEI